MINLQDKPFNLTNNEQEWVNQKLHTLTDEEKSGLLFVILGDAFSPSKLEEIVKKGVGGILFRPNEAKTIVRKINHLSKLSSLPLICCANLEEGGNGASTSFSPLASQMLIGATNKKENAFLLGKESAIQASSLGVNTTFSPDSDIAFNFLNPIVAERSFGSFPSRVKHNVIAEIRGFRQGGIYPVVKHFPGDGVDFRDQHLEPTINSLSYQKWMNSYGAIYSSSIESGIMGIMVGHIMAPSLEHHFVPEEKIEEMLPASLSPYLIKGILRNKFHFNGLVYSDATIMGGFSEAMPRKQAIPLMIERGIDVIVFNLDFEKDKQYILDGLASGLLSRSRFEEAITRILAYKVILLRKKKINKPLPSNQEKFAKEGITLVKNRGNLLPFNKETFPNIELVSLGIDAISDGSCVQIAKNFLLAKGFTVSVFSIDKEELRDPSAYEDKTLTIYLANYPTASNQVTTRISWQKKHALDKPAFPHEKKYLFISLANPFHLMDVSRANAYINAYSASRVTIEEALKKSLGEEAFLGVNPVDPFCKLPDTRI